MADKTIQACMEEFNKAIKAFEKTVKFVNKEKSEDALQKLNSQATVFCRS